MKRIIWPVCALLLLAMVGIAANKAHSAQSVGNFVIPPDVPARYASNIRPAPSYIDARVLAAGVAETHTMPSNTRFVLFASDCGRFYANPNGTAAIPAADVTDGTGSEMNPAAYYWTTPPTSISVISPVTCTVTMSVYLGPVR